MIAPAPLAIWIFANEILRRLGNCTWPARQRGNASVTRSDPRTLGRQAAVSCAGTDRDPVSRVTVLGWKSNRALECGPRLQEDYISARGRAQNAIEIATR